MSLIVYGNRSLEVIKEADRYIATDIVLQISAEGENITDAINALKKCIHDRNLKKVFDIRP